MNNIVSRLQGGSVVDYIRDHLLPSNGTLKNRSLSVIWSSLKTCLNISNHPEIMAVIVHL